jgi:hypothetical protein
MCMVNSTVIFSGQMANYNCLDTLDSGQSAIYYPLYKSLYLTQLFPPQKNILLLCCGIVLSVVSIYAIVSTLLERTGFKTTIPIQTNSKVPESPANLPAYNLASYNQERQKIVDEENNFGKNSVGIYRGLNIAIVVISIACSLGFIAGFAVGNIFWGMFIGFIIQFIINIVVSSIGLQRIQNFDSDVKSLSNKLTEIEAKKATLRTHHNVETTASQQTPAAPVQTTPVAQVTNTNVDYQKQLEREERQRQQEYEREDRQRERDERENERKAQRRESLETRLLQLEQDIDDLEDEIREIEDDIEENNRLANEEAMRPYDKYSRQSQNLIATPVVKTTIR